MIGDRMMADLTEEVWISEKCYLACTPNEYKCPTGPSGLGGRGHVKRLEIDGPEPKSTFGTPDGLDQEIQANDDGQLLDFEAWQLAVADSYSWTDTSSSIDVPSSTDVSGLIDTDNEGDLAPCKVKPSPAKTKDDKIVARGFCAEKGIHRKPVCDVDAGKSSTNFPTWGMNQYWELSSAGSPDSSMSRLGCTPGMSTSFMAKNRCNPHTGTTISRSRATI